MDKFQRLYVVITVFLLVFGFNNIWCIESNGTEKTREKLSQKRYVDPKGYFRISPPQGWRIQKFPQDPRGKVAFIKAKDVDLRALARAADFDTFDGLLKLVKDIEREAGVDTNIQEITFLGRPAVKRNFVYNGLQLLQIDFMEGNIKHNLQYCAPLGVYDKYLAVATDSMNTYETVLRAGSAQDIQKHAVAQDLRLVQLWLERGDLNLALKFVTEGLKIEPKNPDLLKLKRVIEGKNIPRMAKGEKRSNEGKGQLETLKIIKVGVEQSFGEAKSVKLPFYDMSKKILEGSGFTVVGDEANKFDGLLKIKVNGTPLANKYGKDQYLYTGAEIKGNLKFLVEDSNLYSKGFEWRKGPPGMIHFWGKKEEREKKINNLKKPEGAPFSELFEKKFHLSFGDMIYTLWGVEALSESLNANKNWKIRKCLISILGQTKDPQAIGTLIGALGSSGTNVAHHISKALSNFGDAGSDALIRILEEGPINQRDDAAVALGWMGDQSATQPLINAVDWYRKNKDFVPHSFFWAMGMLEDKRSVVTLIEALEYTRGYTRGRVVDALERITGKSFGEDQQKWRDWWAKESQPASMD